EAGRPCPCSPTACAPSALAPACARSSTAAGSAPPWSTTTCQSSTSSAASTSTLCSGPWTSAASPGRTSSPSAWTAEGFRPRETAGRITPRARRCRSFDRLWRARCRGSVWLRSGRPSRDRSGPTALDRHGHDCERTGVDQDSTGGPLPPHGHGPNNGGPRQVTAQPGQSFAGQSPVLPQGSFPPQDSFPPPTAKKPSRRIGAKSAAWALIILGLFGGGTATGWWAHRHFESTRPVDTVAAASGDDSSFLDTASTAMPDVRGLAEPVARQILADAGVAADRLTVESRPFAGLG